MPDYFTLPASVFLSAIDQLAQLREDTYLSSENKQVLTKTINLLMHGVYEEEID